MSEKEKRRSEEPEVEAHSKRRLNDDAAVTPEDRAGESREDDEPDVEAHGKRAR